VPGAGLCGTGSRRLRASQAHPGCWQVDVRSCSVHSPLGHFYATATAGSSGSKDWGVECLRQERSGAATHRSASRLKVMCRSCHRFASAFWLATVSGSISSSGSKAEWVCRGAGGGRQGSKVAKAVFFAVSSRRGVGLAFGYALVPPTLAAALCAAEALLPPAHHPPARPFCIPPKQGKTAALKRSSARCGACNTNEAQ